MFANKKTVATILATFTTTITQLLAVQAEQALVAEKKTEEAYVALNAAQVARDEATRAGAVALKFQNLVDESI